MRIFVSGGTGYLGRPLIESLLASGHAVRVSVRSGSEHKVPRGAEMVQADPFDAPSIQPFVKTCDTYIHLLGTPKPAPWKGDEFRRIDERSLVASVDAAETS